VPGVDLSGPQPVRVTRERQAQALRAIATGARDQSSELLERLGEERLGGAPEAVHAARRGVLAKELMREPRCAGRVGERRPRRCAGTIFDDLLEEVLDRGLVSEAVVQGLEDRVRQLAVDLRRRLDDALHVGAERVARHGRIDGCERRVVRAPLDHALRAQRIDVRTIKPTFEADAERKQRDAVVLVGHLADPDGVAAVPLPRIAPSRAPFIGALRNVLLPIPCVRRLARTHQRHRADVLALAAVVHDRPRAMNRNFEHSARLGQLPRHRDERARRW
jgi:hypothetical protein